MKAPRFQSSALLAALLLTLPAAVAQQVPAASELATQATAPASKSFSQQELDQLLAPIALYPDALLAQMFMAATYPLEVVEAARWAKANPKVTGKALEDAMQKQTWDPAVKSLTAVPQVLQQMNDKLDWMQKLGDAFLAQQQDVMDTVQILRGKAAAAGNLKTTEQQVVKTESQGAQTIYVVESPKPEVVYVPTYNPSVVYGSWWYPTPPYYMYPPAYVYPPGLAFATGIFVGAAIWGGCHWGWGHGSVNVNVNHYNSFNRTNISNANWNHNVDHRGGVAYRDQNVANKYNRGGDASAIKAREDFRGKAESGRSELNNMDRSDLNNRIENADRGAGQLSDRMDGGRGEGARGDRMGGGSDRAGAGNMDAASSRFDGASRNGGDRSTGGGFSGVDRAGASTRDAGARGSASRGDFGGSSSRAGGGGGGGGARMSGGGGGRMGGGGGGRGGRR